MRRESSTVVALAGDVGDDLLAGLSRSPNVSLARAPEPDGRRPAGNGSAGRPATSAGQQAAARPAWEPGARAMQEAARRRSTYVIVPQDPLAGVAAGWQQMWDVAAGPAGTAAFEESAAEALAAWRSRQFELPDYYLVVAPPDGQAAGPDLYLGPLRAARPRRVAVASIAGRPGQAAWLLDTLRSLEHGPWWPPLDELLEAARRFYAGGLAETQSPQFSA
jgi:hypothetical protein